jgi:TonB family protein
VVGGNVTRGATAGTPGGQKIGDQGWRTPKPPYPRGAIAARIQGAGEVRITTDAAGNVKEAVITRSIAPILDANTRSFARANWKGPPNATRSVPVIYRIP